MPALRKPAPPAAPEAFDYPTGMIWCPMKMSGMAILRCARLQKELGCGTRRELLALKATHPERVPTVWPWLKRRRECPKRASESEIRELLLALTPLKLAQHSRKNPRTYRCPKCGGRKMFGARQCRQCWRVSVRRNPADSIPLKPDQRGEPSGRDATWGSSP